MSANRARSRPQRELRIEPIEPANSTGELAIMEEVDEGASSDARRLRRELRSLRSEMSKMRGDMSKMRSDMGHIKTLLMVGVAFFLLRMFLEGLGQLAKHLN